MANQVKAWKKGEMRRMAKVPETNKSHDGGIRLVQQLAGKELKGDQRKPREQTGDQNEKG
jgi:hypothetical protein